MNRRAKLWLGVGVVSIGLAVLSALVILLALEGYLRLVTPPSSGGSIFKYTLATPRYKLMRANTTITAYGVPLSTNSPGFRSDLEFDAHKQPGEFRIIVLGDSFTVAAGVPLLVHYTS